MLYSYVWFDDLSNFTTKSCWSLSSFYGIDREVCFRLHMHDGVMLLFSFLTAQGVILTRETGTRALEPVIRTGCR